MAQPQVEDILFKTSILIKYAVVLLYKEKTLIKETLHVNII